MTHLVGENLPSFQLHFQFIFNSDFEKLVENEEIVTAVMKMFTICWWAERGIRCPGQATLHWKIRLRLLLPLLKCRQVTCLHELSKPLWSGREFVAKLLATEICCIHFCSMCRTVYSSSPCTSLSFIGALSFYWLQIACKTWRRRCRKRKG